MKRILAFLERVFYFFPVQLLFSNLKRNQVLLLCWVVLFMMATGSFGRYLGIPYLFLDPEYLNRVDFTSFFIMGLVTAGFTIAFHITCYISDGHRFTFVGTLARPFTKFSVNNSLIPLVFLITYVTEIIAFQLNNEYSSPAWVAMDVAGFLSGFLVMTLLFFSYFWFTNKDIFKYVVCRIDEKLKQKVQVTRASAMKKLDIARNRQTRVDYYIEGFRIKKVEDNNFYDRATIIQVFDQNHFNLVAVEVLIFVVVLILGIFKDEPVFQLPAAASFIIFLTIFVMLAGAFSYWFGGWSITIALIIFLIINHLAGRDFFEKRYLAFGLNYEIPPAEYNIDRLVELNDTTIIKNDRANTISLLNNWREKFNGSKPKMVFIAASGGGKRAALWALTALQAADSLTGGRLMDNTILMTGASGGLIGATYFRELTLQKIQGEPVNPYAQSHLWKLATDNLNPLIFSLLANDLFVGFTKYEYGDQRYQRDRSYTFEEQLNQITGGLLDKPLSAYAEPEQRGLIPMVIMSPTVVTDGRKLFISAQPAAFMNSDLLDFPEYGNAKISGVDFQRLFINHGGDDLRFLSALRMCATFPYITPNTTLPTEPSIHIMDAGISDNFGLSDAVRFMYAFREWIEANTSGVIFLSIRDSPKLTEIQEKDTESIVDDVSQPISSVYNNFENFQDISNDNLVSYANAWFGGKIDRIDLEYQATSYSDVLGKMDSLRQYSARASLSWRLTTREKQGIINNINTLPNQTELEKLRNLLGVERPAEVEDEVRLGERQ